MLLARSVFTDQSTQGDIWLDSLWQCYSLEPTTRKVPGAVVAMPQGKYEVVMYESPRMKAKVAKWKAEGKTLDPIIEAARVPLLLKVPEHDFIELHPGNGPNDTHDCILPGLGIAKDWVSDSVKAFCALVPKIEAKIAAGRFYIMVIGGGDNA